MELSYLESLGLEPWQSRLARLGPSRGAEPMEERDEIPLARRREWEDLQHKLRLRLRDQDDDGWEPAELRRIGGMDISFENGTSRGTAVLVVCELQGDELAPHMQIVYEDAVDVDMDLPYVSGFLFVRELPAYRLLLQRLRRRASHLEPEIFLIDGCGMYHPRQLGSASHVGVEEDLRTIGVAKKLMLIGDDFGQEEWNRVQQCELPDLGDHVEIVGSKTKRVFGLALRTSALTEKKKQPKEVSARRVYVSVGHRVSLSTARDVVLRCSDVAGGSYIPEPIRLADLTGRAVERAWQQLSGSSAPATRQLVFDVCNLLDEKQRRTLHDMLRERPPSEKLANIPVDQLKRKRSTIEELFEPFCQMHGDVTVEEVRVAAKMEKPWAVALKKDALAVQMSLSKAT